MQEQQPLPLQTTDRAWRLFGYGAVVLSWIIYVILTFQDPGTQARGLWNLSTTQLNLIRLTVALPYFFIWFAAAHGVLRLRAYALTIRTTEHRSAFRKLVRGLSWLLAGLILPTAIGPLRNLVDPQGREAEMLTIAVNFIYVYFPLVGFAALYRSAKLLARENSVRLSSTRVAVTVICGVILSAIYVSLVVSDPSRQSAAALGERATYYLPDAAIFLTLVIPAVASWLLGFLSVQYFFAYLEHMSAVIYEKTLPHIVRGIMFIVGAVIFLQGLLALGQHRLFDLGLGLILVLVYVLLALQAAGYLMIARGAARLAKIDKILAKYSEQSGPRS